MKTYIVTSYLICNFSSLLAQLLNSLLPSSLRKFLLPSHGTRARPGCYSKNTDQTCGKYITTHRVTSRVIGWNRSYRIEQVILTPI